MAGFREVLLNAVGVAMLCTVSTSTEALTVQHQAALETHSPLGSMQLRQEMSDVYAVEERDIQDSSLAMGLCPLHPFWSFTLPSAAVQIQTASPQSLALAGNE